MNIEERVARVSGGIISKEISSIAQAIGVEPSQDIAKIATRIASDFLETNKLIEPVTLARASFYIAAKEHNQLTEDMIKSIIHNKGTTNRWWMYLVPLVERHSKGR